MTFSLKLQGGNLECWFREGLFCLLYDQHTHDDINMVMMMIMMMILCTALSAAL